MLVIGPEIPEGLRPFALSVAEAIRALQVPRSPSPVFATSADQIPPAEQWVNCVLRITDLDILAVSNGARWIRQDTGAPI